MEDLFSTRPAVIMLMVHFVGCVESTNLTFMFVTSFGQFGLNTSGVVPAAEMATRDINARSGLLPGYTLIYDSAGDSQVWNSSDLLMQKLS